MTNNTDLLRRKLPAALAAPLLDRLRKEGHECLTVPTRSQVGKKVVFVSFPGHTVTTDPIFGDSVWSSWRNGWVWIERPANWPAAGADAMVVTGVLAERLDVPVFKLDSDATARFQAGLAVPIDCDAADLRRRFVVVDCTWQWAK